MGDIELYAKFSQNKEQKSSTNLYFLPIDYCGDCTNWEHFIFYKSSSNELKISRIFSKLRFICHASEKWLANIVTTIGRGLRTLILFQCKWSHLSLFLSFYFTFYPFNYDIWYSLFSLRFFFFLSVCFSIYQSISP